MSPDDEDKVEGFEPRNYQVELMEIATKQNTIIYLPTGSGKTFIAVMVLKRMSQDLTRSYRNGGKVSVILVNTVALVPQHAKYIDDHTPFKPGCYTGEMQLDFWTKEEWVDEFNKHQVLIMTSQIFANLLNNSFIELGRVNLIIFDECHRGVEDQPMRQIMKSFQNGSSEKPRIVGLTATLLNGNCKLYQVQEAVKNLETTYHSQVATVGGLEDVVGFSTNPKELFMYSDHDPPKPVIAKVEAHLDTTLNTITSIKDLQTMPRNTSLPLQLQPLEPVDTLKRLRNLITDLTFHIKTLGVFGGHKACLAYLIQIERLKKHCDNFRLYNILNFVLTAITWAVNEFESAMASCTEREKVLKWSTSKVLCLLKIFQQFKTESSEELCALVFVDRRFTAKVVHHIVKAFQDVDPSLDFIKSNFMVGNSNNPYSNTRENLFISKKNREVLESFVNKEVNVLVASNVLEEGVDIPKCTLVVKFDKFKDYRSYIQSKGRARHRSSLYYTIVEKSDQVKFFKKYKEFMEIEGLLNEFLIGKNSLRSGPSAKDLDDMYNEDVIPPYYTRGPDSAQVNMVSAVSLLSRYCQGLSRDQYSQCAAEWYLEKHSHTAKVRVVIYLPMNCPILESVTGPYMRTKKNAKRAAALNVCKLLHQSGELDDFLLPVRSVVKDTDVSYLFAHHPAEKEVGAGFKKIKRLHEKQVPACITTATIPDQPQYLHVIKLRPLYNRSENFNEAIIYDLYTRNLCFGVLTSEPLPELCQFPIYDSNGSVAVELRVNASRVSLSHKQVMDLRNFHFVVFNEVLDVLKEFLVFDASGKGCTEHLLVVPVRVDDFNIASVDFDVVAANRSLKSRQPPSTDDKMNLDVNDDSYLHKIVSPWYRAQTPMYVVTQVLVDKTPKSPFPNEDFPDFVTYYSEKHKLSLLNPNQPMLLVKGLSNRLNAFKPRGRQAKRKKDRRYEETEEYLIPETVIKQEFPSALWVQSRFLPTILSRVIYLVRLHKLQTRIAMDLELNPEYLRNCPELQLEKHLLHYDPNDEIVEHLMDATAADVNHAPIPSDLLQSEVTSLTLQRCNKDYASKLLESEYSWRNIEEPKDIERILDVTVLDIEHYEKFVCHKETRQSRLLRNDSPLKQQKLRAITFPQNYEPKPLQHLEIKFAQQSPNLCQLYTALTAAEANDIVNLERLETLGDSFLKIISSLYIYFKFPNYNEGQATELKGRLVSNKNLYYLAVIKDFGGILKNNDLSPKEEWMPPCFTVPQTLKERLERHEFSISSLFYINIPSEERLTGKLSQATLAEIDKKIRPLDNSDDEENSYPTMCQFLSKQHVSDKTIADCVEALLGAYFQSGGFIGAIKFVEWMNIIPPSESLETLIRTRPDPIMNKTTTATSTLTKINFMVPQWEIFEERLGYHFKNRGFLLQALTHPSYSPNRITQSYERLEFLGDAILDFLITCYIYENCGYLDPGEVTDLRSALVNNNTFASLVVRYDFHKFFLLINQKLQGQIDKFADYMAGKKYVIDDEVLILLEENNVYIADHVDVPKVLGDMFEALAGAVYLDSGNDLTVVWRVFHKLMWQEINLFSLNVPKNVLRKLYETPNIYPRFLRYVPVESSSRTMAVLSFMCEGKERIVHGFGSNKNMARKAAAKLALRALI